jgi:hypothetical protein
VPSWVVSRSAPLIRSARTEPLLGAAPNPSKIENGISRTFFLHAHLRNESQIRSVNGFHSHKHTIIARAHMSI